MLVFEIHRLPLEGAELVERLHLDPGDVLHRRDEAGDAVDVGGVVGRARYQGEADPGRLAERRKPFGEPQGRGEVAAGDGLVGVRIRALDVEQDEIDHREVVVVGPVAEEAGGLDRGVQAHFLGAGKDAAGEVALHHRLAARDREPAVERAQRRRERAQPVDHLLGRDSGPVLEVPGVGVVAVGAAEQAARDEQHHAQARSVVARRRLVGMDVAEFALLVVAKFAFVRRVGRKPDAQVVPAAGLDGAELRHGNAPHTWPWKVRLMTSRCCSLVRRMKFTA